MEDMSGALRTAPPSTGGLAAEGAGRGLSAAPAAPMAPQARDSERAGSTHFNRELPHPLRMAVVAVPSA